MTTTFYQIISFQTKTQNLSKSSLFIWYVMIPTYTDDCLQKHLDLSRLQIGSCQYLGEIILVLTIRCEDIYLQVIVWIVKQGWPWPAWAQGSWWRWGSAPLTCCKLHPSAAPRSSQWTKDVRIQNSNIKMVFWIHFGFSVTSWTAESIFWYLLSRMSFTNLTLSAHIVILKLECLQFHWLFSKHAFVWFNLFAVYSRLCLYR